MCPLAGAPASSQLHSPPVTRHRAGVLPTGFRPCNTQHSSSPLPSPRCAGCAGCTFRFPCPCASLTSVSPVSSYAGQQVAAWCSLGGAVADCEPAAFGIRWLCSGGGRLRLRGVRPGASHCPRCEAPQVALFSPCCCVVCVHDLDLCKDAALEPRGLPPRCSRVPQLARRLVCGHATVWRPFNSPVAPRPSAVV